MSHSKTEDANRASAEQSSAEQAQDALVARLARLESNPTRVRAPQSLQPTPEAARTRVSRLRKKKRLLIQRSRRAQPSPQTIPHVRDPLAP
jgi:hypothetical protein